MVQKQVDPFGGHFPRTSHLPLVTLFFWLRLMIPSGFAGQTTSAGGHSLSVQCLRLLTAILNQKIEFIRNILKGLK